MPWVYERPYKLDITEALTDAGLTIGDVYRYNLGKIRGFPLDNCVSSNTNLFRVNPAYSAADSSKKKSHKIP
jgi:hypothetical protein